MTLAAIFSGVGLFLTLWFLSVPHSPWLLALFTFVAQPCFLVGLVLWLLHLKADMKPEELA